MPEGQIPSLDSSTLRRHDRAIDDPEVIRRHLETAAFGVFAGVADGQAHQNINTFVYDRATESIYFHTAKDGTTRRAFAANPQVSFCTGRMGRLLPAKTATQMSVEYESVIVRGRIEIIGDMVFAREKMQLFVAKYFPHLEPGTDYQLIDPEELEHITAYRLVIESWTGKRKVAAPDFPGAFRFGMPPTE